MFWSGSNYEKLDLSDKRHAASSQTDVLPALWFGCGKVHYNVHLKYSQIDIRVSARKGILKCFCDLFWLYSMTKCVSFLSVTGIKMVLQCLDYLKLWALRLWLLINGGIKLTSKALFRIDRFSSENTWTIWKRVNFTGFCPDFMFPVVEERLRSST